MNKNIKIGLFIVVIAVLAGGAAWALSSNNESDDSNAPATTTQTSETQATEAENSTEEAAATITYSENGFEPETTTVKSGDTVRIVNNSGNPLEFGSDPHPVHTDNPELNTEDIENRQSETITVTTKGNWGFHNHYNPSHHGFLSVE